VTFPPGGRGASKPLSNIMLKSAQSLHERFISGLAVPSQDSDFNVSRATVARHDRFDAPHMQFRAGAWQHAAMGAPRNESSQFQK
jgi:hypothetical protein